MNELINLTPLASIALLILCGIIARYLIPYIRANTTQKEREVMVSIIRTGIYAMEELARTGVIRKEEKYQHLREYLQARGYDLDMVTLEAEIHGELWNLLNQFKEEAAPVLPETPAGEEAPAVEAGE